MATKSSIKNKATRRKLNSVEMFNIMTHLTGIMALIDSTFTLDEIIALHKFIGEDCISPDGTPYYMDDSYALEILRDLAKTGINKDRRLNECARTTSSTKRKASKRKNA